MTIDEFIEEYRNSKPKNFIDGRWEMLRVCPSDVEPTYGKCDCPITYTANTKLGLRRYGIMEAEVAGLYLGMCKDDIYKVINAADSPFTQHIELRNKLILIGAKDGKVSRGPADVR